MLFRSPLALLTALLPLLGAVKASSDVVDLTDANFDGEVLGEKLALVEFFAPWCGHCKNLAPHYEEAATSLKDKGVKLAKVDCTENQDLCGKFDVKGYPTLKVFKSGSPVDYSGPRKADGIISYMIKQSLPAVSEVTAEKHDEFKAADKVVVIAYFASESAVPKAFKSTADQHRDSFLFGYSTDLSLSPTGKPSIVLYKKFDEGQNVYERTSLGSLTGVGLTEWIKENSIPVMDQVSPENFGSYAEQGLPLAYLFVKPDDSKLDAYLESIKPIAKSAKGKINFVWIDAIKFEEHGKSLGVPTESDPYPVFVIQDLADKGKKYLLDTAMGSAFGADKLSKFVQDFEDGQLKPTMKSAKAPETQEGVIVLVNSEYDRIVLEEGLNKDILLEFYAPWCGHCQRLAPIYDSLAEHFEEFKDTLMIAKMDMTENDLPASASFEVAGFPTLKFKKAGSTEYLSYEGDRSLESLIDYIMENSANPIEFANEAEEGVVMGEVEGEAGESGHHDEL